MTKQSQNALTFLRAQYRAIYERAYFKGLATAMIVTSAVASSMAQAATTTADGASADPQVPDLKQRQDLGSLPEIDLQSLTQEQGFSASELASYQAQQIYRDSQDAAMLLAAAPAAGAAGAAGAGAEGAAPAPRADGDPTSPNYVWDGFKGSKGSTFTVDAGEDSSVYGSIAWYKKAKLEAGSTVDIGGDLTGAQAYEDYSKLLIGSDTDTPGTSRIDMAADATLNLGDNTALQINGNGSDNLGGNINFTATSEGSQAIISVGMATDEASQSGSKLTIGGNVTVAAGAGTAAIYAPNVDLQGDITVSSGGTLLLDGALKEANPTDLSANHSAGNFVGHSTHVDLAEGSKLVVGQGDIDKNTVLDLGDGSSDLTGTGSLEVQGTAILTESILDSFITPDTSVDPAATEAGDITLSSGGRLELKAGDGKTPSADPLDLTKYQFGTAEGESQINVLDGEEANTIAGDNLALSDTIRPEGRDTDLNLDIEANDLTLGGGTDFDSAAESLGYRTAVTQNVTFKADSGTGQTFHLQDGVTLDGGAHNGQTGTGTGTSTGDVVLMGGADNLENAYRVANGTYTHTGNITLSGGTLAVGGYGEKYSGDATMSLSGSTTKITVDNTNATNTIVVASNTPDSNATLDLTNADPDAFEIKRGDNLSSIQIGAAGSLEGAGRSEIKLNADQFNDLINADGESGNGVNVILAGNGVLQVPNGVGVSPDPSGSVANLTTSQLQKVTDNAQANQTDKIYFNQGGRLEGDKLQVRNDGINLDIGQGTVAANELDVVQDDSVSGNFVINSGNIESSKLYSSDSSVAAVQVGNGNADPSAVTMVAPADGTSGSINLAINVNGNGTGKSSLNFKNGIWDVDASQPQSAITIDGNNGYLNIGEEGAAAGSGADVTLNGLKVTNGGNVYIAGESDLNLKGETDLRDGNLSGSGDLVLTSGSTTSLNESSLDNFVNAATAERDGGRVILEGGTLDLAATDAANPILINDYTQGSAESDAADLIVTAESTIKGEALAVNDKLNDNWKSTVTLDAGDLVLGGKADTDYSSTSLNFKEALVSNSVRFEPTTNTDAENPTVADTDFYLRDHVTINAAGNGNNDQAASVGDVHIRDTGTGAPTYQVLGGTVTHYTEGTADAPGSFDVNGATVQIGGATQGSSAFGQDATLQFAQTNDAEDPTNTSITDVTIASGSTVKIVGNGGDSTSTLDLRGANQIHTSSDEGSSSLIAVGTDVSGAIANGNTTAQLAQNAGFTVPADSQLVVNDNQLNQLFNTDAATGLRASGDTGVKVVLGQTGNMQINRADAESTTPTGLDVSFLAAADTSTGTAASALEGNKIYFDRGGRVTGDALSLTQKNTESNVNLSIGQGTISAQDLALSNDFNGGSDFVVADGTLEAGKSLSVTTGKLQLGDGTGSGEAALNLGTYTPSFSTNDEGATEIGVEAGYTTQGDVNATIALNGNAAINVNAGSWALNDIEVSGSGNKINVGLAGTNGEVPMVTNEDGSKTPLAAEMTADNFVVNNGNELNINANGTATFAESFASESGGKTVINGKLVIGDNATGDLLEGDISGHGELEVQGTALLTTDFLNDFTSGDGTTTSGGTITLNAGTADFTQDPNASQLDMTQFTFSEDYNNPDADFNIITERTTTDPENPEGTITEAVDASVVKGKDVLIGHAMVENSAVSGSPSELNLDIHATNVTLGGDANFVSADNVFGYHQLVTQNAEFKADSEDTSPDAAMTLNDGITFVATNENGTATTGTSKGNVIVAGGINDDFNSFNVAAGTITHEGNITLDGGTLLIGSTEETRTNIDVDKADATLAMASGSKLHIDNTNASNAIKVQSNGYGSTSTLDFSKIEAELTRGTNLTTITVGSGESDVYAPVDAILKLNNADGLLDLSKETVEPDQQGLAVVLTGNGALEMVSNNGQQAVLDVANIDGYTTTPTSDKIIFSGGGIIMGQDFKLTNQDSSTDKALDLGGGTIKAEKLTLDNSYQDAASGKAANLVLATGKVIVGQELSSTSGVVQIGTGTAFEASDPRAAHPAEVHLGYFYPEDADSTIIDESSTSAKSGYVHGDLILAGDGRNPATDAELLANNVSTNAALYVDYGKWTVTDPNGTPAEGQAYALGDVTVQDGAFLAVGAVNKNGELYTNGAGNEDLDGDGIPDTSTESVAVLQGDQLTVDHSTLIVRANGGLIFNSFDQLNDSNVILKGGNIHINGDVEIDTNPDNLFAVSGRNAYSTFGESAGNQFQLDNDNDTVTNTGFANIFSVTDGATLGIEMGEREFSLNQIKSLRQQLIQGNDGSPIDGGYIDLGKATTSAVNITEDATNSRNTIDYTTESGNLADIKDMVFSNVKQAVLTNVTENDVLDVGSVGSIELNDGSSTVTVKDADLYAASKNPAGMSSTEYFVYNNVGQYANAHVVSGGHLGLHHGGTIGAVTLDDGVVGADGKVQETELLVKSYSGADTYITSIEGGDNTFVGVYNNANALDGTGKEPGHVYIGTEGSPSAGTITAGTLDVNANLTAYNKITLNKALLSSEKKDVKLHAFSLEVNGTTNFTSELEVANNAEFNATATGADLKAGDEGTTSLFGKNTFRKDVEFNGPTFLASTSTTTVGQDATFSGSTTLAGALEVAGNTTFTGTVNQEATSVFNSSGSGSTVTFDNSAVADAVSHLNGTNNLNEAKFAGSHVIGGKLTADTVTVDGKLQVLGKNAVATVENLYGTDENTVVQVGLDGTEQSGGAGDYQTSNGSLYVNNMDLKGGTLFVDPDYEHPTAFTAIGNVEDGVNGNIVVGKNAAIGLGGSLEDLHNAVAQYQNQQGSLQSDEYGAILAVNKPIKVENGNFIAISSDNDKNTLEQINEWRGDADLILSDKAAIIVNLDSINQQGSDNKKQAATLAANGTSSADAVITFDKENAKVVSEGGDLILAGNYDATKSLQIFQDAGQEGVTLEGKDLTVRSESNRFIATVETGDNTGAVTFSYNHDDVGTPNNPVDDAIEDNFNQGQNNNAGSGDSSAGSGDGTESGSAGNGSSTGGSTGSYNEYFQQIAQKDVNTLYSASYLGAFAGAPQVAMRAGQSTADAMAARMEPSSNPAVANTMSSSTGGVWLAPVYSHTENDGFSANGLSYGQDIDLTGVALGAEVQLNNNVKVGAAVNIGTGESKGTGTASTVSNDFNYYGAGAYVGVNAGKVSVMGDINYTVVDNDVSNNAKADQYDTSFNSTNLSAGVNAKLNLNLAGVDVAPHIGVRYSRIEMDDYTVHSKQNGNVAHASSSEMNLLSVPVGVTFSRDIELSTWKLKPMVDLSVTGNFSDTDMDSTTRWGNMNPINLNSEIVDDVTYGVKAGLKAESGNLKLGVGVGYTGSDHSDEINVGAELRYDF